MMLNPLAAGVCYLLCHASLHRWEFYCLWAFTDTVMLQQNQPPPILSLSAWRHVSSLELESQTLLVMSV